MVCDQSDAYALYAYALYAYAMYAYALHAYALYAYAFQEWLVLAVFQKGKFV